MRKIFFVAVFFALMTAQNFSSAADYHSVDWNRAPKFENKEDFKAYIEDCEKNCTSSIPVIFKNGLFVDVQEFLKIAKNSQSVNFTWWNNSGGVPEKAVYEINIYPGAKVAYAYLSGDTSVLNDEEQQLYEIAAEIVGEANLESTTLLKELYIHDAITQKVSYYNAQIDSVAPRHCNAIGALIDGKANCQGYADAFYMLGQMANLDVGKMSGATHGGAHVWNTINFGDDRIYGVDVTWDDASFTFSDSGESNNYIYFNAPLEIMETTHTWEAAYSAKLYPKIDGRYFYYTEEFQETGGKYFAFHSRTAEDALGYIAQRIAKENHRLSWGMAPYNSRYADIKFSLNRLVREILPNRYNWYGSAKMSVARRGNYIFFTVDATKK